MPSAARVQWAKFRVLVTTVTAVVILSALLYELFGRNLLAPRTLIYLYVPDGSGLDETSPVRVDGIDVGRVSQVELSGSNQPQRVVRVTLSIQRDRLKSISADSVTQISSDSLIGDKYVDITSGTSVKSIASDGELIYKNQPELLRSLDLIQFTQQLRLVDATLTDIEQGRSQFGQFYQGTSFYNNLLKRLRELQVAIRDSVSTTTMVGGLLSSDQLHRRISATLENLDQAMAKLQSGQGAGGKLLHDSAQYDELLAEVQKFRQSVEKFGSGDLMQSDRAYVSVNQWLAALIQKVDELNRSPMLTTTTTYDDLNSSLKRWRETVRDFRTNPRKYLRIPLGLF